MVFDRRSAGVLLHPTCLPGPHGIGSLGKEAFEFVDWLASTGARVWQILPLVPNGRDNSPYFSWTAFGGNYLLVDLRELVGLGLLDAGEANCAIGDTTEVDFGKVLALKLPLLRQAAKRFLDLESHPLKRPFERFLADNLWVEDTALFHVLRFSVFRKPWLEWDEPVKHRDPATLTRLREEYAQDIAIDSVLFFLFEQQWSALHTYCRRKGISVLGDVPIYVDLDSCDVWMNPHLFELDGDLRPIVVSGVPPDYFSEDGQLWGNPIYRWREMAAHGFTWWKQRLGRTLQQCDLVRIDHFRGLSAYWEIPAAAGRATAGRWVPGPGQQFFDALRTEWPHLPFVVEDLGSLDHDVHALRDRNGLPGMRILQFGFDGDPHNVNLPGNYPENSIVYTGTHDNETLIGWRRHLPAQVLHTVAGYFQMSSPHCHDEIFCWSIIESAYGSRARLAVVPVQDFLCMDNSARMNRPDTNIGNWKWRLPAAGLLDAKLASRIKSLSEKYGRV